MSSLHQSHDKLFKTVFKKPAEAAATLQHYLPSKLAARIAWETLLLQPGSYVSEQFKAAESDLLYRAKLRGAEKETFLFILFEHQRKKDPWIALRILGYFIRIWEDWRKTNPKAKSLPLIVPVVLVQNDKAWNLSPKFSALFEESEEALEDCREYLPDFTLRLIELAEIPFDRIEGTPLGIMALRILKAERSKQLLDERVWDEALFKQIGEEAMVLLIYILHTEIDKEAFRGRVEKIINAETYQKTMTLAEQFRQEGRQETRQEERARAVIEVLETRFERVPEGLCEEIERIADVDRLQSLLREAIRCVDLEGFAAKL